MKKKQNGNRELIFGSILFAILFLPLIVKANMPGPTPFYETIAGAPPRYFKVSSLDFFFDSLFLMYFSITVLIELMLGYFLFFKNLKRNIFAILLANIISYPLFTLWLMMSYIKLRYPAFYYLPVVIIGEIIVVVLEAVIYRIILGNNITFRKLFIASFFMNLISAVAVLIIWT